MSRRPDTPCAGCGKLLYGGKGALPAGKRTCNECRRRIREQAPSHAEVHRREPKPPAACEVCGSGFKRKNAPDRNGLIQRSCSRECGQWIRYAGSCSPVPWRTCRCGEQYIGKRHCPPEGYAPARPTARTCAECGTSFLAKGTRKYCTESHAQAALRRAAKERRRGRINAGDVVERFGWRRLARHHGLECHICGEECDPTDHPSTGDWYPTVDHLIPISQGGTHSMGNARIAHRYCNSIRGVAPVEVARVWMAVAA